MFLKTFAILNRTLGEKSFTYANKIQTKITKGFSVLQFEAFAIGLQAHLEQISIDDQGLIARLKEELPKIKFDPEFMKITTGGGKNSAGPFKARIEFVEKKVRELL